MLPEDELRSALDAGERFQRSSDSGGCAASSRSLVANLLGRNFAFYETMYTSTQLLTEEGRRETL